MNIKYLIGFTGRSEPDEKTYMYKDMRQVKENKRLPYIVHVVVLCTTR